MSESKPAYHIADDALIAALLEVFTRGQLAMIREQIGLVKAAGYGDLTLRVHGDRIFIVRSESFDAGKLKGERHGIV